MTDGPHVLIADEKFRIVRVTQGQNVIYIFEKADGCDALGCERWREVASDGAGSTPFKWLRDQVIRLAIQEQMHAKAE